MILPLAHDAIAAGCTDRLAQLPPAVAARFLAHLVALADALPPDDRSVLVALVRSGLLEPVLRAWWWGRDPVTADARLQAAWRTALTALQLPAVPLPGLAWPAVPGAVPD